MDATDIAKGFMDSFQLHEVMDPEEYEDVAPGRPAEDPFAAGVAILQAQAASRIESEMECLLNVRGPGQDLFEREENVALAFALFITARTMGGRVTIRNGQVDVGDTIGDMTDVTIEVAAHRSDFLIEFLITWEEFGPYPGWTRESPPSEPDALTVKRELALILDEVPSPMPSDRKTRRGGLASLGLMVMSYERREAERDSFGLAKRALGDMQRVVNDEFIP